LITIVPIALAVPAVVAGAAYIDAKTHLSYDLKLIRTRLYAGIRISRLEKTGRCNPFYLLEDHARDKKVASNTFIIFKGRRWTYKQSYETVLKYGTWLKKEYGVQPGDVVCMDFMNSEKFIFMWFGLWSIGAKPAFINYNLTGKALAHCVRVSTSKLVLVDPQIADKVTPSVHADLPRIQFVTFTPQLEASAMLIPAVRQPDADRAVAKLADMCALIYTSGTTGLPKPAVISYSKALQAGFATASFNGITAFDVFYTCMPLYHTSAAMLGTLSCLSSGCAFAIGAKFSTKSFWEEVRQADATVIQYVGETCRYLLAAPARADDKTNRVRLAFGNGLRPDIWERFKSRFGIEAISEFYSATESSGIGLNLSRNEFSTGAIGRTGSLIETLGMAPAIVAIDLESELPRRNAQGFCVRVPRGEAGELLFQLDEKDIESRYQGYFNNPSATNSKVLRDVFKHGDAWFRSGDLARHDTEGRLFFVDRIGDTFRWKGENVSTNEVAEAMASHRAVEEVNVYGVSLPHHDGRAGCAALVLKDSFSFLRSASEKGKEQDMAKEEVMRDLARHITTQLPRFAVPLFLRVTRGMERTGTNKQQKHGLRVQGVDPEMKGGDELFWLRGGAYVPFGEGEWAQLAGGRVKL
jgi:acyl-CoA synthetase (AMP-forming)/AMP-acid ligase II